MGEDCFITQPLLHKHLFRRALHCKPQTPSLSGYKTVSSENPFAPSPHRTELHNLQSVHRNCIPNTPIMNRFSALLLLHSFFLLLVFSQGCICHYRGFRKAYSDSKTVVKAEVLSSFTPPPPSPPPCVTASPQCAYLPPPPTIMYRFRRIRMYKGCKTSKIFFGKALELSRDCGVQFDIGKVYVLNLSFGKGSKRTPFHMDACQFHREFDSLRKKERRCLVGRSRKYKNRCMGYWKRRTDRWIWLDSRNLFHF